MVVFECQDRLNSLTGISTGMSADLRGKGEVQDADPVQSDTPTASECSQVRRTMPCGICQTSALCMSAKPRKCRAYFEAAAQCSRSASEEAL